MDEAFISSEDIEKLYPNNYDINVLKSYFLMDDNLNLTFSYYYSWYRKYLDTYLKRVLNLAELNDKIRSLNVGIETDSLYKKISSLDLDYVYVRNNIFLDRLSVEEYGRFKESYTTRNEAGILEIVKETFKRLIKFEVNSNDMMLVNYEPDILELAAYNNALVIEVMAKNTEEVRNVLAEYREKYKKILKIPVSIFIRDTNSIYDSLEVVNLENLNLNIEKQDALMVLQYPKFLPIGSVVLLKGGWKKVMVIGFAPRDKESNKTYDYISCLYPDGVISNDFNILFNHGDIKKIYAIGLKDVDEEAFMSKILDLIGSGEEQKDGLKLLDVENIG